jgi:hypothetical protein
MARFKARSFLLAILLAFAISVAGFGTAFADTTDPYLGSYDLDPDMNPYPWGTFVVVTSADMVQFYISPKTIEELDAPPSYFSSEEDAMNIELDITLDAPPSIASADIIDVSPIDLGTNDWVALVTVEPSFDLTFGSLTIKVTNPGSVSDENYTNVTIVRQEEADPPQETTICGIETRVYIPQGDNSYGVSRMSVDRNDFHEDIDRSFPTELDGLFHPYLYETSFNAHVTNILTLSSAGFGSFVQSMTIDRTTYMNDARTGWQYRVYDARHHLIPLSEYVGADSFKLAAGDVGVWKYGAYGDPGLFPDPLPYPTSPLNDEE